MTRSHGITGPKLLSTWNDSSAMPASSENAAASSTSRPLSDSAAATRQNRPGRSGEMTVSRSSPALMTRSPCTHLRELFVGREPVDGHIVEPPPPSTCAVRLTSSRTSPAFHSFHAAGPGGARVGLGQPVEQPQRLDRLRRPWPPIRWCRRRQVASDRDVGQQRGGAGSSPARSRHRRAAIPAAEPSSANSSMPTSV